MQPIGWNPGAEDSIASRMARFIKVDNLQEPQDQGEVLRHRRPAANTPKPARPAAAKSASNTAREECHSTSQNFF